MSQTVDIRELNERIESKKLVCEHDYDGYGQSNRRTKSIWLNPC